MADDDSIRVRGVGADHESEAFIKKFLAQLREVGDGIERTITSNNFLDSDEIKLDTIHAELGKSDAFVFLSQNGVDEALKLASAFVGVQTGDDNMFLDGPEVEKRRQKPVGVINYEGQWDAFLKVIKDTMYIGDRHKELIVHEVKGNPDDVNKLAEEVVASIDLYYESAATRPKPRTAQSAEETKHMAQGTGDYKPEMEEPAHKVCVFCSASRDFKKAGGDGEEQNLAYQLGRKLAEADYGVVSGAGAEHMMGDVVRGAVEVGGWTAGANTPHIRAIEGLPDGLATYIDTPDIYKRMRVMIDGSDGFVIAPGGMGSIQEFLTLLHLKEHEAELMQGKPIVILNPPLPDNPDKGYWDALVDYAHGQGKGDLFNVARSEEEAVSMMQTGIDEGRPQSSSWKEMAKNEPARSTPSGASPAA